MLERLIRNIIRLFYTEYNEDSVRFFWNMVILLLFSVIYCFLGVNFFLTVILQIITYSLLAFNQKRIIYMPVEDDADLYKVKDKKENKYVPKLYANIICWLVFPLVSFVVPHVFLGLKFELCFLALYIPEFLIWIAFVMFAYEDYS